MADIFRKENKNVFFSLVFAPKNQLKSKFEKVLDMRYKNVVLRKTRSNFFIMKNREKNLPAFNQRCLHHIQYALFYCFIILIFIQNSLSPLSSGLFGIGNVSRPLKSNFCKESYIFLV